MYSYLLWLVAFVWAPTIILWVLYPFVVRKYWKILLLNIGYAILFSVPWDLWAIKTDIWFWTEGKNLGIIFMDMPLEEYLFILFVPVLLSTIVIICYKKIKIS